MAWREHWVTFRNNLISNPKFQRWAARFPLTRPIARSRSRALFDLVAGFVYSQVLLAGVRLKLFDILAEGPQTIPVLASRLSLNEPATQRLLGAAVALALAEKLDNQRYALGAHGAALRGNPSLNAMIEHHAMLYGDLADPVALLRGEIAHPRLAQFWAYAANPDPRATTSADVSGYSSLMAESQALIASEVIEAFRFDAHQCLLDVGGGDGAFLIAVAQHAPQLHLKLFDLPAVTERAKARIAAAKLTHRASFHSGSFLTDPLPRGADIVTLIRVFHDHDDDVAQALLHRIYDALPENGVLLIAEPMSAIPGAEPVGDAYFGFYFTAMGSGRTRTPMEIKNFLRIAKFKTVEAIVTRTPILTGLIAAKK